MSSALPSCSLMRECRVIKWPVEVSVAVITSVGINEKLECHHWGLGRVGVGGAGWGLFGEFGSDRTWRAGHRDHSRHATSYFTAILTSLQHFSKINLESASENIAFYSHVLYSDCIFGELSIFIYLTTLNTSRDLIF